MIFSIDTILLLGFYKTFKFPGVSSSFWFSYTVVINHSQKEKNLLNLCRSIKIKRVFNVPMFDISCLVICRIDMLIF